MVPYEEALSIILDHAVPMPVARVKVTDILGCFLAEPVVATSDLPMFDNSAVDGFGVAIADVAQASASSPVELQMIGTVQAGDPGNLRLEPGCAIKTLTGASVVAGVEAVVMREYCQERDGCVYVEAPVKHGENVRRRGEEYLSGQEILKAGIAVTPPVVGLLCTLGHDTFAVRAKPRVAIIITGNELVAPGKALSAGQIYDSNSYALKAALSQIGISDPEIYHAQDNKESTAKALNAALAAADVVISTGGVSVGDYDFVKDVAEELGVQTIIWRIALKPGKPVYFGSFAADEQPSETADSNPSVKQPANRNPAGTRPASSADQSPVSKLVFGLPGNPVSALVTLHQLVKPALLKMMGSSQVLPVHFKAKLLKQIRRRPGRLEFMRGIASTEDGNLVVKPVLGQESHMMGGLSQANCLIYVAADAELIESGSAVSIEMLSFSHTFL